MDLTIESHQSVTQAVPKPATVGLDSCDLSEGSDYEGSTAMGGFDRMPDSPYNANLGGYDKIPYQNTTKDIQDAAEDMPNDPTCLQLLAEFNATATGIAHVRPSQCRCFYFN